jgi:hypothetical protein
MENLFQIRLKKFLQEEEKEFRLFKMYYSKAKFVCYDSQIFTYEIKRGNITYEISFICDDTLLLKMTIKELLSLKRIGFFQIKKFDENKICLSSNSVVETIIAE